MIKIHVRNREGISVECRLDRHPDKCPICHQGVEPLNPEWTAISTDEDMVERVFICPLYLCGRLFIGRYGRNIRTGEYYLKMCLPTELGNFVQAKELQLISPDFCSIYNEAYKAEKLGLLLVSGPGYRKALEFLIKDYLTSLQTTDEAKKEIADSALMVVIKKYVSDKRMLTTAERAAWLGNDETHYVRKWEDKDLQDLKDLIQLTSYWILSEHLTQAVAAAMPQGKK